MNRHIVDRLADVRAKIKELQDVEADLRGTISAMMGDRDSLGGDEFIAMQRLTTRKGAIDTKAMEAAGIDPDRFRKPDVAVYSLVLERREVENV